MHMVSRLNYDHIEDDQLEEMRHRNRGFISSHEDPQYHEKE